MRDFQRSTAAWMGIGLSVLITACGGGGGSTTPPPPTTYVLTVNSSNPSSGVAMGVSPADANGATNGTTSFTRTYNAGTSVTLTAPAISSGNTFSSWTGCTSASTVTCTVAMNANATVAANYTVPVTTYVLTVNSSNPSSGVAMGVSPADANGATNGTTSFTRTYNAGTSVTLTAPATSSSNTFSSWTGCTSASTVTCTVAMNANAAVTANYTVPAVAVTPNPATATIGSQVQFTATVAGTVSSAVTWSLAAPSGSNLSPGTISTSGLYTTPYPAPATVTVTATSTQGTTQGKSASVTVTLNPPATAAGPALTVDVSSPGNAISPLIYGMNAYYLDTTSATTAHASVARWGGDDISRYNYLNNITNSASDWYFENFVGAGNMWGGGSFTGLVTSAASIGAKTLGTVPVLGWVANSTAGACSFTQASYPGQESYSGSCGDGIYLDGSGGCTSSGGCDIMGTGTTAFAEITSIPEPPPTPPASSAATTSWALGTWAGSWVNSLVTNPSYGNAASGKGVAIWDLDNEPTWWSAVHRDVHPNPFTYDEATNGGIGTALAIKKADPTAEVSGPVVDYWWAYFYSMADIWDGWAAGPCYEQWSNPVDRRAHGGVPFIEYYLQQFAAAENTYGMRLLDYVDLHTYFAADNTGLTTAGNTSAQQARLNSTRVFWDPTYTDPTNNYPQPNYTTDPNYTTSCSPPQKAPQLIRMMKTWVANDYPGTKLAIDEYNFGGLEAINGAVTQADILGIFGREGLDLGAFWPTQAYNTQGPGNMAFAVYRNYDGNNSTFGNTVLPATSGAANASQGTLSVYAAQRTSDSMVTVVVINKTYGPLTSTLSLTGLPSKITTAQAYLYSNANLAAIVAQPAVTVTPPAPGSTSSTIAGYTFPAQSITLFVVPTL